MRDEHSGLDETFAAVEPFAEVVVKARLIQTDGPVESAFRSVEYSETTIRFEKLAMKLRFNLVESDAVMVCKLVECL